ncbi:RNase H1/viroplasmin domain-containing protein [Reichenbachiella sp.]|uniref:RNase H1/viroplasmin domain-containing protein n=1 Tax=Reichenbachiella sp. TaxID=2184521 RepID=UPI003267CB43
MAKSTKYYVVWNGRTTGILLTWAECEASVKGFSNAQFKSFPSLEQANDAYKEKYQDFINNSSSVSPPKKETVIPNYQEIWDNSPDFIEAPF